MIAWQGTPRTGMSIVGPVMEPSGQLVIERARQDARRRGLADPAHAGEYPGLWNAAALEGVRNRAHHRVLADQIGEGRRPVFAREYAIGAGRIGHLGRRVVHGRFGLALGVLAPTLPLSRKGSKWLTISILRWKEAE